jgi:hypothetical protein
VRAELIEVYTGALYKALEVADSLETVAFSLQNAINRLVENDTVLTGYLPSGEGGTKPYRRLQ